MKLGLVLAALALAVVVALVGLYLAIRAMARREPYGSFLRLPTRRKIAFFRGIITDSRVPWWVKAAPFVLALYLAIPIDIVPDFIPVLGYLDDVGLALLTLALVVRFIPREVIQELLRQPD
ncbi:MAG: DUF1232 domain-containing protein [Chloroflexi bacterium]|nr:DUF1232 domain-containing protein [Chloroflexota bacterium]